MLSSEPMDVDQSMVPKIGTKKHKKLRTVAGVGLTFLGLFSLIVYLVRDAQVTVAQGGLMLVALFGLYVGFGILIAVYRVIVKLE